MNDGPFTVFHAFIGIAGAEKPNNRGLFDSRVLKIEQFE
jgi:hypothetical protein